MNPEEWVDVRLRLIGGPQFAAEASADAAALREIQAAAESTGRSMERAGRRSFLMNQALFTIRRVAYGATLALGAAGAGAVAWGLSFNATMEQNRVAFEYFTGSTQEATKELDYLYNLAALTPFEFPQLVDASRKFLAFGFSVDQTNSIMKVLGDTIAGLGLGSEGIDRAVLAIGQMRAAGRVLGGEIRQLTELGIPALQILQEQLGLTSDQVARIGELRIPADVAIAALVRGLNQRFEGMAERQSRTFKGQVSTLRDYTAQALGTMTEGLFQSLTRRVLPTAVKIAQAFSEGYRAGGWTEAFRRIDQVTGANGRLYAAFIRVRNAAQDFGTVMRESVYPVFVDTAKLLGAILLPILWIFTQVLHVGATNTDLLRVALQAWVYWLIASRVNMIRLWIWTRRMVILDTLYRFNLWLDTMAMRARIIATWLSITAIRAWMLAEALAIGVTTALTEAVVMLTLALLANPITAIVVAVLALAVAFGLLYWKVKAFRDFVNRHWPLLLFFLGGAFSIAVGYVIKYFSDVRRVATNVFNWIVEKATWAKNKIVSIFTLGGRLNFLSGIFDGGLVGRFGGLFANGGLLPMGQFGIVGERGPEMVAMTPAGAKVLPLAGGASLDLNAILSGALGPMTSHTKLYLDGRQVAESNAKYQLDSEARR